MKYTNCWPHLIVSCSESITDKTSKCCLNILLFRFSWILFVPINIYDIFQCNNATIYNVQFHRWHELHSEKSEWKNGKWALRALLYRILHAHNQHIIIITKVFNITVIRTLHENSIARIWHITRKFKWHRKCEFLFLSSALTTNRKFISFSRLRLMIFLQLISWDTKESIQYQRGKVHIHSQFNKWIGTLLISF